MGTQDLDYMFLTFAGKQNTDCSVTIRSVNSRSLLNSGKFSISIPTYSKENQHTVRTMKNMDVDHFTTVLSGQAEGPHMIGYGQTPSSSQCHHCLVENIQNLSVPLATLPISLHNYICEAFAK